MFSQLLNEGGLSLDRLESFCLVAQAGGVTKAADRLTLNSKEILLVGGDVVSVKGGKVVGEYSLLAEREERLRAFAGYQINAQLLARAAPGALVLHCLPAHRGEEITHEALEGPQSAVFDQAENRLHAQKAIMRLLLADDRERVIAAARNR